ncbi:Transmembrane protein, partial [Globisporangium splendens]
MEEEEASRGQDHRLSEDAERLEKFLSDRQLHQEGSLAFTDDEGSAGDDDGDDDGDDGDDDFEAPPAVYRSHCEENDVIETAGVDDPSPSTDAHSSRSSIARNDIASQESPANANLRRPSQERIASEKADTEAHSLRAEEPAVDSLDQQSRSSLASTRDRDHDNDDLEDATSTPLPNDSSHYSESFVARTTDAERERNDTSSMMAHASTAPDAAKSPSRGLLSRMFSPKSNAASSGGDSGTQKPPKVREPSKEGKAIATPPVEPPPRSTLTRGATQSAMATATAIPPADDPPASRSSITRHDAQAMQMSGDTGVRRPSQGNTSSEKESVATLSFEARRVSGSEGRLKQSKVESSDHRQPSVDETHNDLAFTHDGDRDDEHAQGGIVSSVRNESSHHSESAVVEIPEDEYENDDLSKSKKSAHVVVTPETDTIEFTAGSYVASTSGTSENAHQSTKGGTLSTMAGNDTVSPDTTSRSMTGGSAKSPGVTAASARAPLPSIAMRSSDVASRTSGAAGARIDSHDFRMMAKQAITLSQQNRLGAGAKSAYQADMGDIGALGIGLQLYFMLTKCLSFAFLIMGLMSLPAIIVNLHGHGITDKTVDPLQLAYASLGNEGVSEEIVGDPELCLPKGDIDCTWETVTTPFTSSPVRVSWIITISDCVYSIFFLFFYLFYRYKAKKAIEVHLNENLTPAKYAVKVRGLPPDATEEEILRHFNDLYDLTKAEEYFPLWFGCCWARRRRVKHSQSKRAINRSVVKNLDHLAGMTSITKSLYLNTWIAEVSIAHPTGAAAQGSVDGVQVLLQHGAHFDHEDESKRTALFEAVEGGHIETVVTLVEGGAHDGSFEDMDLEGRAPLVVAASTGCLDTVNTLIGMGTSVSETDHHGRTALFAPVEQGHVDLVRLLLSDGKLVGANKHLAWQKMHEAALGLEYLHGQNVTHNDLKCDNVLIGLDGKAKLIDFGLSCLLNVAEIQVDVKQMGALHWKSPEYLAGGHPSFASDVYSFAMCILEVVTDDIPWERVFVKCQVKKEKIPTLPDFLSNKQRNLIELMTRKDPLERVKMSFVADVLFEIAEYEAESQPLP